MGGPSIELVTRPAILVELPSVLPEFGVDFGIISGAVFGINSKLIPSLYSACVYVESLKSEANALKDILDTLKGTLNGSLKGILTGTL